jgi:hypothetical protein
VFAFLGTYIQFVKFELKIYYLSVLARSLVDPRIN